MNDLLLERCSDCGGKTSYKMIPQEFEREGMRISISGIKVIVCENCGEVYFPPGGADKLTSAANSMFELAKTENQHKGLIKAQIGQD